MFFFLLLLPPVIARGPPGMIPPTSFVAESWYPSNLPTVLPPWKQPGVDINQFRTQEVLTSNSITSPMDNEAAERVEKTTKMSLDFQEDSLPTEQSNLSDITITKRINQETIVDADKPLLEGSGHEEIIEVRPALETTTISTSTTESPFEKGSTNQTRTSSIELQTEKEEERKPFSGEETIFEVTEKSKTRGEGGLEKRGKEKKECSDLIFVIDSSGNVMSQYEKQKELVRFILLSLGQFSQKRRLGLITYASRRKQRWNINPLHNITRDLYLKKLKKARFLGGITATGAVLKFLAKETAGNHSSIVLLTDGFSFDEVGETAEKLRESASTDLYVTGDYFPIVRNVLNEIAGDSENVFFGHRSIRKLIELLKC